MKIGDNQVLVQRIDTTIPLPEYQTKGSIGFDFAARTDMTIPPHSIALIPTNMIIQAPAGYGLFVFPRSSLARKKGLQFPHSVGVIDHDYCGPEDEIFLQVENKNANTVTVAKGDRLAQGVFLPVLCANLIEVAEIQSASRGGFGSTGHA